MASLYNFSEWRQHWRTELKKPNSEGVLDWRSNRRCSIGRQLSHRHPRRARFGMPFPSSRGGRVVRRCWPCGVRASCPRKRRACLLQSAPPPMSVLARTSTIPIGAVKRAASNKRWDYDARSSKSGAPKASAAAALISAFAGFRIRHHALDVAEQRRRIVDDAVVNREAHPAATRCQAGGIVKMQSAGTVQDLEVR